MIKKLHSKIYIFFIIIVIIIFYLVINFLIGNDKYKNYKSLLNFEHRQLIKKYIFPYKLISQQELKINQQDKIIQQQQREFIKIYRWIESFKKRRGSEIMTEVKDLKLSNNKILKKYEFTSGFYAGIGNLFQELAILIFIKVI